MRFDPTTPTELQRQDWTCSIRSVMWMLKSLGIAVTPEDAQDAMSPQYVTPALGLLDASGAGMVAVLRDHWGVAAVNDASATFDDVAALAGRQPLAIGLRNWGGPNLGHWSPVRGHDGERLFLANPAGTGPQFGQQTLTRAEFDQRGPASLVTIPLGNMPETIRGIDVSSWQGEPDWRQVAASGVEFAITKATQGTGYLNPTFARNWHEIRANGLVRGAYHYAEPHDSDAAAEAAYFVGQVQRLGLEAGDLLALDIEPTQPYPGLGGWSLRWLDLVERATGVRPLVYTGRWIAERDGLAAWPQLAAYPLWLAAYQERQPAPPAPWSDVAIWQHSDKGRVPGISGDVDLNRYAGNRAQLLALGKPPVVAPPVAGDPRDEQISGLLVAVAYLADDVVPLAAAGGERGERAIREARRVREEFVGPKPFVA